MERKTLWFVRGVSGSGKSTVANKLRQYMPDADGVEADDFWYIDGKYVYDEEGNYHAHQGCFYQAQHLVETGFHNVIGHYHEISVNKVKVCLFHFPVEEWHQIHRGAWHFHGHLHGQKGHGGFEIRDMDRRMDLGVDAHPDHLMYDMEELIGEQVQTSK